MTLDDTQASFFASGPGFDTSGDMAFIGETAPGPIGGNNPVPFGSDVGISASRGTGNDFVMLLDVSGVGGWSAPDEAFALASFFGSAGPITHAGTYSGELTLSADFFTCNPVPSPPCPGYAISGTGTMLVDMVNLNPELPNLFFPVSATVTFRAPEPSIISLLLLGLAALGFQVWARAQRQRPVN
jgi:hypothetical protein